MFTGQIADRVLVREVYSSYSNAAFQQNADAWLACWSDEGVWFVLGDDVSEKVQLRRHWETIWQNLSKMAFLADVSSIEIKDDNASSR